MPPPDNQENRNVDAMVRRTRAERLHPQYTEDSEDQYPGARRRAAAAAAELPEPELEKRQYQSSSVIAKIFKDWIARHAQYDLKINGIRIASWIDQNAQGYVCEQNLNAACRALSAKGMLLEIKKKSPAQMAVEEDSAALKPGQLSVDASEQELRDASLEQVKDVLRRRRALAAKQKD